MLAVEKPPLIKVDCNKTELPEHIDVSGVTILV
jgi:hypothetical protein